MSFIGLHAFGITEDYGGTVIPHFENSHKHISRYQRACKSIDDRHAGDDYTFSPVADLAPPGFISPVAVYGYFRDINFTPAAHAVKTKRFILLRSILI